MTLNDIVGNEEYVKPHARDNTVASYPALLLVQNGQRFYFATMPVDDIFPYCYVVSRQEDPIQGFQRTLNRDRAADIARYLDQSEGSIPTNIVLSVLIPLKERIDSKGKSAVIPFQSAQSFQRKMRIDSKGKSAAIPL